MTLSTTITFPICYKNKTWLYMGWYFQNTITVFAIYIHIIIIMRMFYIFCFQMIAHQHSLSHTALNRHDYLNLHWKLNWISMQNPAGAKAFIHCNYSNPFIHGGWHRSLLRVSSDSTTNRVDTFSSWRPVDSQKC